MIIAKGEFIFAALIYRQNMMREVKALR